MQIYIGSRTDLAPICDAIQISLALKATSLYTPRTFSDPSLDRECLALG